MCGIAGWFDTTHRRMPDRDLLQGMNDAIAHRGPDGEGLFVAPGIGLAHRRLAVIDLASGKQPMRDVDGVLAITFNGEIYNFLALKAELTALGHKFRTKSDTEVILEAWKEWGENCVTRLNGMFAFAIWDARQDILFLARDRLGEKPLYYSVLPDSSLVFGSEMGALIAHPAVRRDIDPRSVEEFFALGYVVEPRTIYSTVFKLQPGHYIVARRGSKLRHSQYWDVRQTLCHHSGLPEMAEELRARLETSVSAQMVSDVPIGAFLSGGIDSGVISALMAQQSANPLHCFTIGFNDPAFDESALAGAVAEHYGARHRIEKLEGTEEDLVGSLAKIAGEPFGDSSMLPTLRLMRLARAHVTVALSGDGGDELFAGYRRYGFHLREEKFRGWIPKSIRSVLFGSLGYLYPQLDWAPRFLRARQTLKELGQDTAGGYFANVSVTDDRLRAGLFSPAMRRNLQGYRASERIEGYFSEAPFEDPLAKAQYVDLKTWLAGDILMKVDRTAMACGLEVRVPMLDADLVEWSLNLPQSMKHADGRGKVILKQVAGTLLPATAVSRPKQGFSVPLASWFRGSLGQQFEKEFSREDGMMASGYFDPAQIRQLLLQHRHRLRDHSRTLWLCWMFDKFLRDVHYATPSRPRRRSEPELCESAFRQA